MDLETRIRNTAERIERIEAKDCRSDEAKEKRLQWEQKRLARLKEKLANAE